VPHVVAVKYVNGTIFPAANHNVWMICSACAVGQKKDTARGDVQVASIQGLLVIGCEVINDSEARGCQLQGSAWVPSRTISAANSWPKNFTRVGMPFLVASLATLTAGSMPSTGTPFSTKYWSR
jgi:hypothetical protein